MKQVADNDEFLTRYLLGELSEEDQEAVEERYISEPEFYEKLLAAEDDLIDAFARSELSESRRQSFENRFLCTPDRRQRVEFASDWRTLVSRRQDAGRQVQRPAAPKRPFAGFLKLERPMALRLAAAVLVLIAGAWFASETIRLRSRLELVESQRADLETRRQESERTAEDERRRSEDLRAQLDRERIEHAQPPGTEVPPDHASSAIISTVLIPGVLRSPGRAKTIVIPPSARYVNLQVNFTQGDYQSYRAVIETVEGRPVWAKAGLSAHPIRRGKAVYVRVAATVFDSSEYILTLSGVTDKGTFTDVEEYAFTTKK